MDILPIQSSAVPCEQVFSSSKETMRACRNHIGPDLMEALQLLKFSIWQGQSLNFTSGFDWGDKIKELEEDAQQTVNEDIILLFIVSSLKCMNSFALTSTFGIHIILILSDVNGE